MASWTATKIKLGNLTGRFAGDGESFVFFFRGVLVVEPIRIQIKCNSLHHHAECVHFTTNQPTSSTFKKPTTIKLKKEPEFHSIPFVKIKKLVFYWSFLRQILFWYLLFISIPCLYKLLCLMQSICEWGKSKNLSHSKKKNMKSENENECYSFSACLFPVNLKVIISVYYKEFSGLFDIRLIFFTVFSTYYK